MVAPFTDMPGSWVSNSNFGKMDQHDLVRDYIPTY